MDEPRKRSPRSPVMPLKDALERAAAIHQKEGRHSIPATVAAQDMGYKDATGGRAKRALAALRQFGLIVSTKEGYFAVTRQFETYKFAPDEPTKRAQLLEFFRSPSIYKVLIGKFPDRLPSDAALKFELIQLGFLPDGVEEEVKIFRQSAEFSGAYSATGAAAAALVESEGEEEKDEMGEQISRDPLKATSQAGQAAVAVLGMDRIPIRLAGGRRAVLEIPTPFFEADKQVIKAQVELILTDTATPPGEPR